MSGLDWDRLRRRKPLDGADRRVDADGASLWEQEAREARAEVYVPFGARRLRRGVIARPRAEAVPTAPVERRVEGRGEGRPTRCMRCGANVSMRKLLRHKRRCGTAPT